MYTACIKKGNQIYLKDLHVIRWLIRIYFENLKKLFLKHKHKIYMKENSIYYYRTLLRSLRMQL